MFYQNQLHFSKLFRELNKPNKAALKKNFFFSWELNELDRIHINSDKRFFIYDYVRNPLEHFYEDNKFISGRMIDYSSVEHIIDDSWNDNPHNIIMDIEYNDIYRKLCDEAFTTNFFKFNYNNPHFMDLLLYFDCLWLLERGAYLYDNGDNWEKIYDFDVSNYLFCQPWLVDPCESDYLEPVSSWKRFQQKILDEQIGDKQSGDEESISIIKNRGKIEDRDFDQQRQKLINKNFEKDLTIGSKRTERSKRWEQSKIKLEGPMIPSTNEVKYRTWKKNHDRKGFASRHCHPNTPFLLIPDNFEGTDIQRLEQYNRSHLCPCKRRYNIINYDINAKAFVVSCDHHILNVKNQAREILDLFNEDQKCRNCGAFGCYSVNRRSCECDSIVACSICKKTYYSYKNKTSIICLCKQADDVNLLYVGRKLVFDRVLKQDNQGLTFAEIMKNFKPKTLPLGFIEYKPAISKKNFLKDLEQEGEKQSGFVRASIDCMKSMVHAIIDFVKNAIGGIKDIFINQTVNSFCDRLVSFLKNIYNHLSVNWIEVSVIVNLFLLLRNCDSVATSYFTGFNIGALIGSMLNKSNIIQQDKMLVVVDKIKSTPPSVCEQLIQLYRNVDSKYMGVETVLSYFKLWINGKIDNFPFNFKEDANLFLIQSYIVEISAEITLDEFCGLANRLDPVFLHEGLIDFVKAIMANYRDDNPSSTLEQQANEQQKWIDILNKIFGSQVQMLHFVAQCFIAVDKKLSNSSEAQSLSFSDVFDMTSYFFGLVVSKSKKYFMLSSLRDFNTICSAMRNGKSFFSMWIEFLPEFIKAYFKPNPGKAWLLSELEKEDSLASELMSKALRVRLGVDLGLDKYEIVRLREDAKVTLSVFEKFILDNSLVVDNNISKWLNTVRDIINTSVVGVQREKEPFCVRITGKPGCMKSTYWATMVSGLFKESIDEIENEMTYTRHPGVEFWDGLNVDKHRITLYDDFGQQTDELDFAELISLVSCASFSPPMASIDSKSEMGFKGQQYAPDLVVLLSNLNYVSGSKTVNFSEAVERRPHITITFPDTCKAGADLDTVTFEYRNRGVKPQLGSAQKTVVGIQAVQELIVDAYLKYSTNNNYIKDSKQKYAFKGKHLDIRSINKNVDKVDMLNKLNEQKFFDCNSEEGSKQSKLNDFTAKMMGYLKSSGKIFPAVGHFLKDKVYNPLKNFFHPEITHKFEWKSILITLLTIGTPIVAICILAYIIYKKYFDVIFGEDQSGTISTKLPNNMTVVSGSRQESDNCAKVFNKNQCEILTDRGRVLGLFVADRYLLTVRHIFVKEDELDLMGSFKPMEILNSAKLDFLQEESEFTIITKQGQNIKQKFYRKNIVELYEDGDAMSDLVLYRCDKQVSAKKNIINHFIKRDQVFKDLPVAFNGINIENGDRICRYTNVSRDNFVMKYSVGKDMWAIANSFAYPIRTIKGDCGAFIYLDDPQPKIIGIHIAGYAKDGQTFGVATRVTSSMLEVAFEKIDMLELDDQISFGQSQMCVKYADKPDVRFGKALDFIGELQGCKSYPVGKTDLAPSPLYDAIVTPTTMPSIINIYDKRLGDRNLILEGVNKYGKELPLRSESIMNLVRDSLIDDMSIPSLTVPVILTVDEAINGNGIIKGLDMSTSAGFPFSCEGRGGEKKKFFSLVNDRWIPNEELKSYIDRFHDKLTKGIIPFSPWVDCLKDERRTLEKIKQCKTRLFSSASVEYIINFKRYYGAFIQHMNELKILTFSRIGLNKDSIEWDEHIRKLMEVGNEFCIDLDYSAFDGTNCIENIILFFEVADNWYASTRKLSKIELCIRKTLQEFEIHGIHCFYDKFSAKWLLYQLIGRTNSGTLITVNVNTISNEANMRYIWIVKAPDHFKDLYYYKRFVRTAEVGDDLMCNVHLAATEFYNPENIVDGFEQLSLVVTSGSKDGSLTFQRVEDSIFLKNKTGVMLRRFVPLMDIDPMLETLNWIRRGEFMLSEDQACEDNCNNVLRNCFWYGQKFFKSVRQRILYLKPFYKLLDFNALMQNYMDFDMLPDPLSLSGKRTVNL